MAEELFKRKLEDKIRRFMERKEIIGVRGPRQAGKTTLLKMISGKITGNKAFVNLDLIEYRRALEESPLDFVKRFKKNEEKTFLFLDEIQKVKDAGEKLKIIFDEFPDIKILFSGSSSLELKTNVLPFLVGRLFLFELSTFDFGEFLSTKDEGLYRLYREKHTSLENFLEGAGDVAEPSFTNEFLKHWKDYVIFGGYPEIIKSADEEEKRTILSNIFNLYLEKDITSFFRIEETSKFEDFTKLLSFNISNILSLSSLASDTGLTYKRSEEILSILEHTYIIHLLKPFCRNLNTEIKKAPKIHFLDIGLRNSVIGNFSPFDNRTDNGKLAENFVFRELFSNFKDYKINYWRTTGKAEIDFILRKDENVIPVEVRLSGDKLGKSFYSFLNAYKPEKGLLITLGKFGKQNINGTVIYHIPIFYF